MVFPDFLFDQYRICVFALWKKKDVTYSVLSLTYGTILLLSTAHLPASDPFLVKDTLALLIIVYSLKSRDGDLIRGGGVQNLLKKIRQDATTYFLALSTGHLLFP